MIKFGFVSNLQAADGVQDVPMSASAEDTRSDSYRLRTRKELIASILTNVEKVYMRGLRNRTEETLTCKRLVKHGDAAMMQS